MNRHHGLKHVLQRVALRTQYPPFVWFYRALYGLSIRLCVRRLRRIPGVCSIYLRRGLTSGDAAYGLSDIDMLAIIQGDSSGSVAARVQYQYDLIRRMIPMFAEGELAVCGREQFQTLYRYSPFYRGRFERGRQEWKLLFGSDVFGQLPPSSADARLLSSQELKPAWYYLGRVISPDDKRPLFTRRYVAYKSIADSARAALLAQGYAIEAPRRAVTYHAAEAFPEVSELLKEIGHWRGDLLSPKPLPLEELLDLYLWLARKNLTNRPDESQARRRLRILSTPLEIVKRLLGEGAITKIQQACAEMEGIEHAVLVPRLSFDPLAMLDMDPDTHSGATIDAFDFALVSQRLPPHDQIRRFNSVMGQFRPIVNPYFCDGEIALSLMPAPGSTVKDSKGEPEFFACLASTEPLYGGLTICGLTEVERSLVQPDALERRARTLLALFSGAEAFRLPVRTFYVLFWEAGRAALLAAQADKPVAEVPVSSTQVVDALAALTPSEKHFLQRVHREYWNEVLDRPSEAVRYMRWAGDYARTLEVLLFKQAARGGAPSAGPRTELTISVVIVTRNAARLLGRALQSLLRQERRPDQVVVVDNNSSDNTRAVALQFTDALPLTLVKEDKIGIPYARNTGQQHSTGDIVAFLDSDCEADPRWLAELEVPFLKDPHIGAVGGSTVPSGAASGLIGDFYRTRMIPAPPNKDAG